MTTQMTIQQISLKIIIKEVSNYFDIPIKDILSDRRTKLLVIARHVGIRLSKVLTNNSNTEIAEFYNRDVTLVNYAVKSHVKNKDRVFIDNVMCKIHNILLSKFDTM